jgi:hypothetical protein
MSAFGTKQTYRGLYYFVRFQGEADMHDRLPLTSLSAIDPEQTSNDVRSPTLPSQIV